MVLAPVLWSTAGVVTRHVEQAAAFERVFWRSLFAFAFVGLFLLARRESFALRKPVLLSGAMWAIMFTAFMLALQLTSTANTLVVMSVSPLLTALLARAFLSDPLPLRTWLAVSAAAFGIAWMFASGLGAHSARDYLGMAIAALVPVASAINVVTLRARSASVDLRPAVMLGGAISCLVALPLAFPLHATPRDVALLAFLGVFQLGLPCVLLVVASRALAAPEIALLGLLEVLLGPLWVWLGAAETPARSTLVGGAIVLGALALNELAAFRLHEQRGEQRGEPDELHDEAGGVPELPSRTPLHPQGRQRFGR
jgi:drug/metabolite transporter (DMT)-like permease